MKLSVVVPMLNEAPQLPGLLARLTPLARNGVQVILVDGGSHDGSADLAQRAGFHVLHSARGRARQMNAGAAAATGDVLMFLHADTELPEHADTLVLDALRQSARAWGRFDVRIAGRPAMLKPIASLMNWRSRLTGIATGDQAMFVRRAAFIAADGFPMQPLMEDIELSRRLRRRSPPLCLRDRVTTSGRRWETHGVWRTIVLMWRLRFRYWLGTPAEVLAEFYR